MSRTTHHIRPHHRRYSSIGTPFSLEMWPDGPFGDSPRDLPVPRRTLLSWHRVTDLRYSAAILAAPGSRPIPERVVRTSLWVGPRDYATSLAEPTNQAERRARADVRDRLRRLAGLHRAGCDCPPEEHCDGLQCTDESAIEPLRHRGSALWDVL